MFVTRRGVWEQQVGRTNATFPGIGRGNGYLVPILGKTEVAYDGRGGTSPPVLQDVPVAVGVDSSEWVSGALIVKLHAKNTWSTTATLRVLVQNIMLVPEEPDVVYLSSATPVAQVDFVNTDVAPALKLTAFSGVIGPMFRVLLRWEQGATALTGPQTASVSIDLVGRPA